MDPVELKSIGHASREVDGGNSRKDRDAAHLARVGKRAVLGRNFGLMSILGFSCTILCTWEAIFPSFLQAFQKYKYVSGGPAGAVYGYILVWIGTAGNFLVLSELVSMAPTSGGQYHWCSMLAPRRFMKLSSYVTGWMAVVGWQATFASLCYIDGTLIQAAVILTHSEYVPKKWHTLLMSWAVLCFALFVNSVGRKVLPKFEGFVLILHIVGFFAILIPMVYLGDHNSNEWVFKTWNNYGNWSTQGLSFFVGLLGPVATFAGGDAAIHMVEEIENATKLVPWSIMLSVLINGSLGFGMLLAALYCVSDVEAAINSATGYPFVEILLQATGSVSGTAVLLAVSIILNISACTGMLAASSRQFWSFSRDRAIPGWRIWSYVSKKNLIPIYSVAITCVISAVLNLIPLGSAVAFNDLLAMSVTGLFLSYIICTAQLLYRRIRGEVGQATGGDEVVNTAGAKLVWGPFYIPGTLGIINNAWALIYMVVIVFFSFWPPATPVTVETMNFSVVGTMGTLILSLCYYLVRARKVYEGPIIEVQKNW
ncbi:choline transport protein [Aspergillus alliaceus]|uniref:Choline transport protein n=1 Tax=Petromyces alliaceus TaxID=209559 RepID=A0A5N7CL50_PETAA|nr:choline transport protein [Aspergillus alliaceus]